MKDNNIVKSETKNIAIGILICSIITQLIFFVFRKDYLAIFLGSLYGGLIALSNFYLMALSVKSTASMEDQARAKLKMQASYSMRQIAMLVFLGLGMYISVNYKFINWLPMLLAILYPRIIIAFRHAYNNKKNKKEEVL